MSFDTHLSFWDRIREFLLFLATVIAVLAGAEVVMLLRGGDVEARTGGPAASGEGAEMRSADATWAPPPGLGVQQAGHEGEGAAGGAASQKDQ
jgi:hypothetical protein